MTDLRAKESWAIRSRPSYIHLSALAAAVVAAALFYPQFSLNHDTSWYLVGTRMFLEGERLYSGVVEINPPLAFYLTVPAIWLSDLSGLTETAAFRAYAITLSGICALALSLILRRSKLDSNSQDALFLGSLLGLLVLPLADFGQREHLMLIFSLPYLFLLALGDDGPELSKRLRASLGLVATLGLGLKPYFFLIPALMVLAGPIRLLWQRAVKAENLGLASGVLVYLGFIALVHPQYLTEIVPMARLVYGSFEADWRYVVLRPELAAILCLCVLFAWKPAPESAVDWTLLGGSLGALLCYLVQFKAWSYQLIPLNFFQATTALWLMHSRKVFTKRRTVPGLLAMLVISLVMGSLIRHGPYRPYFTHSFSRFVERPGQAILVMSSNVSAAFPFINEAQARWASRYPAQWLIPGAMVGKSRTDCRRNAEICEAYDAILGKARDADIEDLLRYRPDLVYIDDRKYKSYFESLSFDYLEFLKTDPRFPPIWAHYAYRGRAAEYTVWARFGDGARGPSPVTGHDDSAAN